MKGYSFRSLTDLVLKIFKTKVIAGTGLSGGGSLEADRTLAVDYGTAAGTAAQGNDNRLSNSREWTAGTISQAETEAGTATTRRAFTAQRVRQAIVAWFNGISGALGRTILTRTTAAQVRSDIGLGTAATKNVGTAAGQVMQVGAFGLGNFSTTNTISDNKDIRELASGIYSLNKTHFQNIGTDGAVLWVGMRAGTNSTFILHQASDSRMWISTRWSNQSGKITWAEIYHTRNMPVTATRWPSLAEVTGTPANYPTNWDSVSGKPVVQTVGTSTTDLMSQKAVTDALSKAGSSGVPDVNNILFKDHVKTAVEFDHISVSGDRVTSLYGSPYRYSTYIFTGGFSCKNPASRGHYTTFFPQGIALDSSSANVMEITGKEPSGNVYGVLFKGTVHVDRGLYTAHSSGTNAFMWAREGFRVSANGVSGVTASITANGAATFLSVTQTSDDRYKDKKEIIESPLYKLSKISGYIYDLYTDKNKTEFVKRSVGVIAQDVEKVLPECVEESDKKTVSYSGVTALLVESVKELMQKVESLEKEIKLLKQGN